MKMKGFINHFIRLNGSKQKERGQVMVILVFAVVGLLGFTALAIDGGMLYADRRVAQNGADASAFAGIGEISKFGRTVHFHNWDCSSTTLQAAQSDSIDAAISHASLLGFTIQSGIGDKNGVITSCSNTQTEKYIDVQVMITDETPTSFAQFVYKQPLKNTVEAVVRYRAQGPLALGMAIVALNQDACSGNQNGVIFHGSSEVQINGGGVFSNGCLRGHGSDFRVNVTDGGVSYAGETSGNTSPPSIVPEAVHGPTMPEHALMVPTPNCSSLPNRTQSGNTLLPGIYTNITLNNGNLNLQPGLYCLTGSPNALRVNGGTFTGNGVTIYIENGGVSISGNAEVDLVAPSNSPDPSPAIPGILIYLAEGNTSSVDLEGNATSRYVGAIYAPDGDINARGTNNTEPTFHTQLIGKNVQIGGNANIDINFDSSINFQMPPYVHLSR